MTHFIHHAVVAERFLWENSVPNRLAWQTNAKIVKASLPPPCGPNFVRLIVKLNKLTSVCINAITKK